MAELVRYAPEHARGFRELVAETLREFGFSEDPALDTDLLEPERAYDAVWIVLDGGRVAGSAAARELEGGVVELKRMYLAARLRGRGLGRALLERVVEWARLRGARRIVLDTGDRMAAAQHLYEAAGFRRTGERWEEGAAERRHELLYALDL